MKRVMLILVSVAVVSIFSSFILPKDLQMDLIAFGVFLVAAVALLLLLLFYLMKYRTRRHKIKLV